MIHKSLALSLIFPLMVNVGCQPNSSPIAGRPQPPASATLKKVEQSCLRTLKTRMVKSDFSFVEVSNPQLNNEVKNIMTLPLMPTPEIEYTLTQGIQKNSFTSMGVSHSKKANGNVSRQEISLSVPEKDVGYLYTLNLTYSIEAAASGTNTSLNQKFKIDSNCHSSLAETDFTRTTLSDFKISALHLEESAEEKMDPFHSSRAQTEVPTDGVLWSVEPLNEKLATWKDLSAFLSSQEKNVLYFSRIQEAPYILKMRIDLAPDVEHFDPLVGHQAQFHQLAVHFKRFGDSILFYSTNSEFRFRRFDNGTEKWIVNSALFENASF
ncbi:MAG TPA: hypothetical protein VIG33_04680 [Pseudobdellovibrionaceae bacterium]|jgi:hypothetical protein